MGLLRSKQNQFTCQRKGEDSKRIAPVNSDFSVLVPDEIKCMDVAHPTRLWLTFFEL